MLSKKKLIVLMLASMICMKAFPADDSIVKIAKVEFSKLKNLLIERVFKKSNNIELKIVLTRDRNMRLNSHFLFL